MRECIDEQLSIFINSSCPLLEKLHIAKGQLSNRPLEIFLETEDISDKCSNAKTAIKQIVKNNSLLLDSSPLERMIEMQIGLRLTEYRDHFCHSLYVFLIGLYISQYSSFFQRELKKSGLDQNQDRFLKTWLYASLFHDIGYIFVGKLKKYMYESARDLDSIFETRASWIEHTPYSFSLENLLGNYISEDTFKKTAEETWTPLLNSTSHGGISPVDALTPENSGIWSIIGDFEQKINLSQFAVKSYYDALRKKGNENARNGRRKEYYDHGILSAALLYKLSYAYYKLYMILLNRAGNIHRSFEQNFNDQLGFMKLAIPPIAIHHVRNNILSDWQRKKHRLQCLNNFTFKIKDAPLAFLLILSDEIHSWERPYFQEDQIEKAGLPKGKDISLTLDKGVFRYHWKKDEISYRNFIESTEKILNIEEVRRIVKRGRHF